MSLLPVRCLGGVLQKLLHATRTGWVRLGLGGVVFLAMASPWLTTPHVGTHDVQEVNRGFQKDGTGHILYDSWRVQCMVC